MSERPKKARTCLGGEVQVSGVRIGAHSFLDTLPHELYLPSRLSMWSHTLHPTTLILHLTLYTVHPSPCNLRPSPCTPHPTPYTQHPTVYTLHPTPHTLHFASYTLNPIPYTLHPAPSTLNSKPDFAAGVYDRRDAHRQSVGGTPHL